jgi:AP2-associated kinase
MSDDGHGFNDPDDISPEMRRELERRRLSQEEKRVAAAAAEYRLRVAERGEGGLRGGMTSEGTRSAAIQNKVQSLLRENNKPPSIKKPSGYGRFTDPEAALQVKQFETPISERPRASTILRRPVSPEGHDFGPKPLSNDMRAPSGKAQAKQQQTQSTPFTPRLNQRPAAPPKPKNLRTGGQAENPVPSSNERALSGHNRTTSSAKDEWEANFSKRYPSLSGLEMVETEIDLPKLPILRTKEV